MTIPKLLTRNDAAAYLTEFGIRTAPSTLAKLFSIGGGPKCRHIGRRPFYSQLDLHEWIENRLTEPRRSSSEPRRQAAGETAGEHGIAGERAAKEAATHLPAT